MRNPVWTTRPLAARAARLFAPLIAVAAAVFLAGCGGGDKGGNKSEVSGKVTLGDKPVSGVVTFITADGQEVSAPTDAEGKYSIANPPTGQVSVIVKPLPGPSGPAAVMPKGGAEMPKESMDTVGGGVPPPARYQAKMTSGLTYDIKPGKQTYDIPLK